jgi:DNA-binding NarL/FixJ family response regulator
MSEHDPRWDSIQLLQNKLQQQSHNFRQEIFLNAACDAVLGLIENGIDSLSSDEVTRHYMKAGINAIRRETRRQLIAEKKSEDIEYVYYGSYIDADTILMQKEIRCEILQQFTGQNRKILDLLFTGYRQTEIANDCDIPYPTVRQRLTRIRKIVAR